MANLYLTNLASFKAYFQAMAVGAAKHVDLEGFKWGDKDVLCNDNRSDLAKTFLWTGPYEGVRYNDPASDNITKNKMVKLSVFTVADSERFADEDAAVEKCEAIMEDIVARLLRDKRGADVAGVWTMLVANINSATGKPVTVELGSTQYHGWELSIELIDNRGLQYNAAKWNS